MSVRIDTPNFVHEGTARVFRITTTEATTGHTVEFFGIDGSGTATPFGSANGASAGTEIAVTCSFVGVDPGNYRIQVVAGRETLTPPKVLWPDDDNEELYLVVRPAEALAYTS